jgi:glycosyltransferase involved in cell wall biosynthesis
MAAVPRVSVGMPVHNGERYLPETIDCLLNQTFADFELVISDNASTDRTEEICRDYALRDNRIRYSRNGMNVGLSRNYRRVFELSRAGYFKWATYDDVCRPEFLARCVEVLDREGDVVLVYPKTTLIDEFGRQIALYDDQLDLQSPKASERFRALLANLGLCNAQTGLIRAHILRRTRVMGDFVGADICLLAELSLHGKFYEIPEFLFSRRFHPACSSWSRDNTAVQMRIYDPNTSRVFFMREWRHLYEKLRAVARAPLHFWEKVEIELYLLRAAFWSRNKLLQELLSAVNFRLTNHQV